MTAFVGRTWREAEKVCDARIAEARTTVRRTLRSFADLGQALLEARDQPAMLERAVSGKLGWDGLQDLVAVARTLDRHDFERPDGPRDAGTRTPQALRLAHAPGPSISRAPRSPNLYGRPPV